MVLIGAVRGELLKSYNELSFLFRTGEVCVTPMICNFKCCALVSESKQNFSVNHGLEVGIFSSCIFEYAY